MRRTHSLSVGDVTLEFEHTMRGLSQRFSVRREGERQTLCAGGWGQDVQAGDIFMVLPERDPVVMAYTAVHSPLPIEERRQLEATIERDAFTVHTTFVPAPDVLGFDVVTRLTALVRLDLVAFLQEYTFPPGASRAPGAPLEFAWVPALKSAPQDVIGDHAFRSPCVIARHAGVQVALVPHLNPGVGIGPLRSTLDFQLGPADAAEAPRFSVGFQDYVPAGHVCYRPTHLPVVLQPGGHVEFGFTLLFDLESDAFSFQPILRFLWQRYGAQNFATLAPQVLPFDDYARYAYDNVLDRYRLWREFDLEGRPCGGTCVRIVRPNLNGDAHPLPEDRTGEVIRNYMFSPALSVRDKLSLARSGWRGVHPHIWNQAWFNNLRTSFGMAYFGRRWDDARLTGCARKMWNLALAAPAPAGIFPAVFSGDGKRPSWVPGTRGWFYSTSYHTPDAAWTGYWMLQIFRHLERDEQLLGRCQNLGDFFVRAQLPSGAIPAWVELDRAAQPRPVPPLQESASAAAAGLFLAALHELSGRDVYLEAARRVADFVVKQVFPAQAWFDFETFFSCSPKPLDWRDPNTGLLPQNTLSIFWAAELLRSLYVATQDAQYLRYGRAVLDLLLLYQQIWDAPFLRLNTLGGFGAMNTDAEWNDARQSMFATLLMSYYDVTGEPELFLRGVAALRASFALMYVPENRAVAPGNVRNLSEDDWGATAENYGHSGYDAKIQGYVMPDWGSGGAASAAALAQLRYGDLFVDVERGQAFGVNGCRVLAAEISPGKAVLTLEWLAYRPPQHFDEATRQRVAPLQLKCARMSATRLLLHVNGEPWGSFGRSALEQGVPLLGPAAKP